MADQGKRLEDGTRRALQRLREYGKSIREAARAAGVAKSTAQKYLCRKVLNFGTPSSND